MSIFWKSPGGNGLIENNQKFQKVFFSTYFDEKHCFSLKNVDSTLFQEFSHFSINPFPRIDAKERQCTPPPLWEHPPKTAFLVTVSGYFCLGGFKLKNWLFFGALPQQKDTKGGPRGGMCPPLFWGFEGGVSPLTAGEKNWSHKV